MMLIYERLTELMAQGRSCALATLVATSGSSPQNAGAKVLFLPNGQIIGTIGGGCMEAEARRIGLECLRKKTTKLFDLRLDDDFGWDDGLICGGSVRIFINPYPERCAPVYRAALDAAAQRERVVLCTFLQGETPPPGTALLLDAQGRVVAKPPTLEREPEALGAAVAAALESGREKVLALSEGVSVYLEPILPRPTLVIAGAGHIGAAVAQIGALCGFEVVIVDDRPDLCNPQRLPFVDRAVVEDIPRFVRDFPINEDTYIVIVTRGHRHDAHVLRECIHSRAKYIGMIGSKRKITVIYEEMLREGLATKEALRRVHSPMGLALGDREVGEIAVSIAAELVAVRRGVDRNAIRSMQYLPPFIREEPG
jgi:xanthine dehydrogenase accessory factor